MVATVFDVLEAAPGCRDPAGGPQLSTRRPLRHLADSGGKRYCSADTVSGLGGGAAFRVFWEAGPEAVLPGRRLGCTGFRGGILCIFRGTNCFFWPPLPWSVSRSSPLQCRARLPRPLPRLRPHLRISKRIRAARDATNHSRARSAVGSSHSLVGYLLCAGSPIAVIVQPNWLLALRREKNACGRAEVAITCGWMRRGHPTQNHPARPDRRARFVRARNRLCSRPHHRP